MTINVDDRSELDAIARIAEELGRPADICLRVLPFSYADPAELAPDLAEIARDRSHDKWGMDRETILEVVPEALGSDMAPPPRPASSRLQAPRDARGLRARVASDRRLHRGAARPLRVAARGARLRRRLPARAGSRERRTLGQPPRRHARGVRGGDHVDAAGGARGALARASLTSCSSRAGGSSATRPSCSHGSASSSACRPGTRRGSTSTRARTTARAHRSRATTTRSSTRRRGVPPETRRSASSGRRA